jgi:predicted transposase/invertase (TIGR01784 family)
MSNEEFAIPELLPPREDGIFKTLLTHPRAKPVLRDVIASVLAIPVVDVEVRNTELPISDIAEKRERFDVNCRFDGNRQAGVEMQSDAMKGDNAQSGHRNIKSRAIYNLCDLHASQEGRSISYGNLMQSFQITFCDYTVFPKHGDFVRRFGFRDENGIELSDSVGIVFVELSKLGAVMKKPPSEMTELEFWCVFFAHAHEPEHRELLNRMIAIKEEIRLANELLTGISKDEIERAHFRSRRMFRMDTEHDLAVTRDEGVAEGKIEVARNLLKMNLPAADISKATGLPHTEIEKLRN